MAKFNCIKLEVENGQLLNINSLREGEKDKLKSGDVVYIYRNSDTKRVYVGQTKHFITRNEQHYNGTEQRFELADFDQVLVIYSQYFNRSALDDVEAQLIIYFHADSSNNRIDYDETKVLNLTLGNSVNEYRDREKVASEIIIPLWEEVLFPLGWVNKNRLDTLRAEELVKYSPIKVLTQQQMDVINNIMENPERDFVVNGDPGTGKTILLTHLVAKIIDEKPDFKVGVVVQPNWIKTAEEIFRVYNINNPNLYIKTSTQLINNHSDIEFDIIIVDESHKLSRRGSKQMYVFNKVYEGKFENYESHLEILKEMTKQLVLMYDVLQAIRPANISRTEFKALTADFKKERLNTQFRIKAPEGREYGSEDYINGIKYLLYKDTGLLEDTTFDPDFNREVFNDEDPDAYFGYFEENPLHNLFEWKDYQDNLNPQHMNRVVGGLVEPWKQSDGKDETITHWHEGNMERRWNSTQENWINSDDADASDQVGSVFAVQGIDLNYVGVLIGNDLQVDKDGCLYAEPDNFHNVNGKFKNDELELTEYRFEFTLFVLNIYYILLTRGIDGVRVGFWKNNEFKEYFKKTLEIGSYNLVN